jgi:hypothetical protein
MIPKRVQRHSEKVVLKHEAGAEDDSRKVIPLSSDKVGLGVDKIRA